MTPEAWITLVGIALGLFATIIGGLLALWFRAGRILERINHMSRADDHHASRLDDHERRLTRAEIAIAGLK